MTTIIDRADQYQTADQPQSAGQWLELLAHHMVTQHHITVTTRGTTAKAGTVMQLTTDGVYVVGVHGAGHQIPFQAIETLRLVGAAAAPLGPLATQHIYQFAGHMARATPLGFETADDRIARALVRQIGLEGIVVADTFDDLVVAIPFADLVHITAADAA